MPLRRLDAQARAIVNLADRIAREYDLEYVGTEHILLAILRHNDNPGARTLGQLGITEEKVRAKLTELLQRSKEDTWVLGRLPGTPHYRNVIEQAIQIAEQLQSQTIGAAHLLLALYDDEQCAARRALVSLGVTLKKCRDEVLRQLAAK